MKTKYNDNRLAEELDLIVLTNDRHLQSGLPKGSLGTLTYSYTGANRPLYGEFIDEKGNRFEEKLDLFDFRVLDLHARADVATLAKALRVGK